MPRTNPPFASGKPYFRRDASAFQQANRPTWTPVELRETVETIWLGDSQLRDYYEARKGRATLPGLPPGRDTIPQFPYLGADVNHARQQRTLPPRRDAAGNPIPPAPVPAPAPAPVHPPPRPRNQYPYDFWPQQPWHVEPDDPSLDSTLRDIREDEEHRNTWLDTLPHQWQVNESNSHEGAAWLGGGAYGCAGLWCRMDDMDNIVRRFVIKETRPNAPTWRDPALWRDEIPREIRIHQLIDQNRTAAQNVDHENLAEHDGYRLMMRQRRYRIYLNYYEGGDLWEALEHHFEEINDRFRFTDPPPRPGWVWDIQWLCFLDEGGRLPDVIPEGLIWRIVQSLITACQILHFGRAGNVAGAVPNWKPITHCDITLANIFLQPPVQDGEFPTFVLSDYGLSFYPHDQANIPVLPGGPPAPHDNPSEYMIRPDDARYPPELQYKQTPPQPLGEKTDVWQIGAILFYLLSNGIHESWKGPTRDDIGHQRQLISLPDDLGGLAGVNGHDAFTPLWYPTITSYSVDLRRLCANCLTWDPNDRPTLLDMRNRMDAFLNNAVNAHIRDDRGLGPLQVGRDDVFRLNQPYPR